MSVDEFIERCYWHLNALYEVDVLRTPLKYWNECYNICNGLPLMSGKCEFYISNKDMMRENKSDV